MVDGRFTKRYADAMRTLGELTYARWRDFDAEDTLRFFALRLQEIGMIRVGPE